MGLLEPESVLTQIILKGFSVKEQPFLNRESIVFLLDKRSSFLNENISIIKKGKSISP
jgi:hypothetical protein